MSSQMDKTKKKRNLWTYFWSTIIGFFLLYLLAIIIISYKYENYRHINKEFKIRQLLAKLEKKHPEILKIIDEFSNETKQEIKKLIDKEIDEAYQPVYSYVDDFTDFHFSLKGEYTELALALEGKIAKLLKEKLFDKANFEERINQAFDNINKGTKVSISENLKKLKQKLRNEGFSYEEIDILFKDILKLTKEDIYRRFQEKKYLEIRAMGLGGGIGTGIILGTALKKRTIKLIEKKITKKIARKTGSKIIGKAAAAASGASLGLSCGPLAIGCAIIGGIVGWVASDKIIIEIDAMLNKDKFKQEIVKLIDEQKNTTKQILYSIFINSFEKSNVLKERLENLKKKPIIENLKN